MDFRRENGDGPRMDAGRHLKFDGGSARPGAYRGPAAEIWRGICAAYLKISGWKLRGDWPRQFPKMVLIAAPHTSNWDGVNMLAAAGYYRVPLKWMGKKELVDGPFGGVMKWLGCVPVDRKGANDLVRQMQAAFERADSMVLAIPPEGTRSAVKDWKTGFYHISLAAGVPLVMSVLDYGARTISISGALTPGGDYSADLPLIKSHYDGVKGLRRDKFIHEAET